MWDCKTTKGKLGPIVRVTRTCKHRVSSHKYKDLFTLFKSYDLISQPYRENLAPGEQNLFINRGTCGLRPSAKTGYTPACSGTCGRIHSMASASLNKRCKDALEVAGVDVSVYSSHAIRGNVECAMIQASHESSRLEGGEAIKRPRLFWGTFEKNYKHPADALYLE